MTASILRLGSRGGFVLYDSLTLDLARGEETWQEVAKMVGSWQVVAIVED